MRYLAALAIACVLTAFLFWAGAKIAMMVFARGLAKLVAEGKKVTNYVTLPDGSSSTVPLPDIFSRIDAKVLGGNLSVVTLVFLRAHAQLGQVLASDLAV